MKKDDFEAFLHVKIPITKAMGISVLEYDESSVSIKTELAPNINHKGTAFGGSINTAMTVCGWAHVHAIISAIDPDAHIVIQKSEVNYRVPITDDFTCKSSIHDDSNIDVFVEMYKRKGKSKIDISVRCFDSDTVFAEFNGRYVVYR